MKTLKKITFIGLISMFTLTIKANSNENPNSMNSKQLEQVQKELNRTVQFPDNARQDGITGSVKAQLIINAQGRVDVDAIQGEPNLTNAVRKQLEQFIIKDNSLTGIMFIANFEFR